TYEGAFVPVRRGVRDNRCEIGKLALIELDSVVTLPEIDDGVCAKVVREHERVAASLTRENIPRAAHENILAVAAANLLEPKASIDDLLAVPARNDRAMTGVGARRSCKVSLTWLDDSHG